MFVCVCVCVCVCVYADVCWCKGSIAEKIFTPMVEHIRSQGGEVLGNKLVTGLVTSQGLGGVEEISAVEALDRESGVCVCVSVCVQSSRDFLAAWAVPGCLEAASS